MKIKKERKISFKYHLVFVICIFLLSFVIIVPRLLNGRREVAIPTLDPNGNQNTWQEGWQGAPETYTDTSIMNEDEVTIFSSRDSIDDILAERITIIDENEFLRPVLRQWQYLMIEAVTKYVRTHQIDATEALVLNIAISRTNPARTEFYLELNDPDRTLLTASYSNRSNTDYSYDVMVWLSQYSREEIENSVWEFEGPAIRDVPE